MRIFSAEMTLRFLGRRALATSAAVALLGFASSAQALYVSFDAAAPTTDAGVDLMIDGQSVTITTEKKIHHVATHGLGFSVAAAWDEKVITFNDGPVALTTVVFDASTGGKAILTGLNGETLAVGSGDVFEPLLVEKVARMEILGGVGLPTGIVIDSVPQPIPTNPVPEPGAALLFGAGLSAVAASGRRRR